MANLIAGRYRTIGIILAESIEKRLLGSRKKIENGAIAAAGRFLKLVEQGYHGGNSLIPSYARITFEEIHGNLNTENPQDTLQDITEKTALLNNFDAMSPETYSILQRFYRELYEIGKNYEPGPTDGDYE